MKTKIIILSYLLCFSWIQISAATHHLVATADNITNVMYLCNKPNDTIIIHAHAGATNTKWESPSGQWTLNQDSIIVTTTNQGTWRFKSQQTNNTWKNLIVVLTGTPPYEAISMQHDTTFCSSEFIYTLDAQNTESNATYAWNDLSNTETKTITTPGIFWCQTTNNCGTRRDSVIITQTNPNGPHLGADTTVCSGSTIVLDPSSTNVGYYEWSTGVHTPTIIVDTTGTYWVHVEDNNGCGGRDTIHITVNETPTQGIKLATINTDETSPNYGNNKITWEVNPALSTVTNVVIHRESGTDNYIPIDTVNYIASEWSDVVNSIGHSWKYKISLIGSPCGEGNLSESVQTIHCWVSQFGTTYTIQWDPYSIGTKTNTVNWYKVLSGNELNGLTIRDSVSGNLTSLSLPNTTDSIFVVGAELVGGKGFTGLALSNKTHNPTIHVGIVEMGEIPFSIYPNPAKELINININLKSFRVEIRNIVGQVLLSQNGTKSIDISSLAAGSYVISVIADNIKTNKKFIKN